MAAELAQVLRECQKTTAYGNPHRLVVCVPENAREDAPRGKYAGG
jgi:hypothetical protein